MLNDDQIQEVELKIEKNNAPYVITKPFHHSQKVIDRLANGSVIVHLRVHLNLEFDRLILGFGDSIEVLKPKVLRNRIKRKLIKAASQY